jgi:hypothetical protein
MFEVNHMSIKTSIIALTLVRAGNVLRGAEK